MTKNSFRGLLVILLACFALTLPTQALAQRDPVVLQGAESSEPVVPFVFEGSVFDLPPVEEWRPGDPIREIPRRFHPMPKGAPEFTSAE